MHNTHYVIVKADSNSNAESCVQEELDKFGTSDNWYTIERVIDLDNLTDNDTEHLEKELKILNSIISEERYNQLKEELNNSYNKLRIEERHIFSHIAEICTELYEIAGQLKYGNLPITVSNLKELNENFFGFKFDEYGITYLENFDIDEDDEDIHTYYVEVNMHS